MTDDTKAPKQTYDEKVWPFKTITPEQFYSLPIAHRLAIQKMVRDMVDGTNSKQ